MLTLKQIKIHNFLSYQDLTVDLRRYSVCQLIGSNGSGKTNLISAITEAAYGKNIRGYSKEELSNRYSDEEGYQLTLTYSVGNDEYVAHTKRTASKVTVSLSKNGKDISGHTVKDTYNLISESFGYTYEMFCQLIYQSTDFSMNFLKSTPAVRRKFLVTFTDADEIQQDIDLASEDLKKVKASLDTAIKLADSTSTELTKVRKQLQDVEVELKELGMPLTTEDDCLNLITTNEQKIREIELENSAYQAAERELSALEIRLRGLIAPSLGALMVVPDTVPVPTQPDESDLKVVKSKVAAIKAQITKATRELEELNKKKPATVCYACGSHLSNDDAVALHEATAKKLLEDIGALTAEDSELAKEQNALQKDYTSKLAAYREAIAHNEKVAKIAKANSDAEQTHALAKAKYDASKEAVETDLAKAKEKMGATYKPDVSVITTLKEEIEEAKRNRATIIAHRSKTNNLDALKIMEKKYTEQLSAQNKQIDELALRVSISSTLVTSLKEVLARTFEESLSLLERLTNSYLAVFSNGKFAIKFVADSTNLNVQLFNQGIETKLHTASKGQETRITISCLLAIRKLLTSMAKQPINLLVLDEVLGVLDSDGKEQLLTILEAEKDLNIYLVSHEWSHPLLSKIYVSVDNRGNTKYEYE